MAYSRVKWTSRTRDRLWLRIDMGHADAGRLVNFMKAQHLKYWPNNHEHAVLLNLTGTEGIVKMDGATDAWKTTVRSLLESGLVLGVYTRDNYRDLAALMLTRAWWDGTGGPE